MNDRPIGDAQSIVADAVEMAGGQRALARLRGIAQSDISQALNSGPVDARNRVLNGLGYVVATLEVIRPMKGQNR
ncbi:helix-turn-helix domain-containing protein [Gluconobacter sp. P5B12]|uniref:helix-turn-helix domain-containing protein n=1 Tax=unclassified Gluconobacter TaxID=2644261 RepID=UPI001C055B5D|nr:helix-turn-helix domain-containing protein [Gluconobacter sp. P5B12]